MDELSIALMEKNVIELKRRKRREGEIKETVK
jgi:hypothetical protein